MERTNHQPQSQPNITEQPTFPQAANLRTLVVGMAMLAIAGCKESEEIKQPPVSRDHGTSTMKLNVMQPHLEKAADNAKKRLTFVHLKDGSRIPAVILNNKTLVFSQRHTVSQAPTSIGKYDDNNQRQNLWTQESQQGLNIKSDSNEPFSTLTVDGQFDLPTENTSVGTLKAGQKLFIYDGKNIKALTLGEADTEGNFQANYNGWVFDINGTVYGQAQNGTINPLAEALPEPEPAKQSGKFDIPLPPPQKTADFQTPPSPQLPQFQTPDPVAPENPAPKVAQNPNPPQSVPQKPTKPKKKGPKAKVKPQPSLTQQLRGVGSISGGTGMGGNKMMETMIGGGEFPGAGKGRKGGKKINPGGYGRIHGLGKIDAGGGFNPKFQRRANKRR